MKWAIIGIVVFGILVVLGAWLIKRSKKPEEEAKTDEQKPNGNAAAQTDNTQGNAAFAASLKDSMDGWFFPNQYKTNEVLRTLLAKNDADFVSIYKEFNALTKGESGTLRNWIDEEKSAEIKLRADLDKRFNSMSLS